MIALAIACALIPGFDVLNYFSSLACAIVGAVLCGFVGIAEARFAKDQALYIRFFRAARSAFWLAVAPIVVLSITAIFVRNCDYWAGFSFYLMGPLASMLFASQIGAFIGLLIERTKVAYLFFVIVWIAWIGADLWHLYAEPPIFAYNAFVGFFSGAIYDDVITIESAFVALRGANLLQLALMWVVAGALVGPGRPKLQLKRLTSWGRTTWIITGSILTVLVCYQTASGWLGYQIDDETIAQRLGGRVENDRIIMIYDRAVLPAEEASQLLEDHHFRLVQIEQTFQKRFPDRITSYVYGSKEQKRRLMGARDTLIAKPWLRAIHLNRMAYGAPVIKHELAHVYLGMFSKNFLKLPTTGPMLPQMGLIEGAAEALEWHGRSFTPHEWTAAMYAIEVAPPLQTLMRPTGFWNLFAGSAYTVAGSFIRWLIDQHGPQKFAQLYEAPNYVAVYGKDLSALEHDWRAFLGKIQLPDEVLARTRFIFDRSGILGRVCPLVIPRLEENARELYGKGEPEAALKLYQKVVEFVPEDGRKRLGVIATLAQLGRYKEAAESREALAKLPSANPVTLALADRYAADAAWRANQTQEALARYRALSRAPLNEDAMRNILVKTHILQKESLEPILGPYLLGHQDGEGASYLMDALSDFPNHGLIQYLLGRRLLIDGKDDGGQRMLELSLQHLQALPITLRASLERETWRLLAASYLSSRKLADATRAFSTLRKLNPRASEREYIEDKLQRIKWLKASSRGISGQKHHKGSQ